MKAHDWFALMIRLVGLLALPPSALCFLSVLGRSWGFRPMLVSFPVTVIVGISATALSLYLLRGAPHIVRFAYSGARDAELPS